MKFKRINQGKKPNNKRGILLILLLFIIIYLWYNAERLIALLFDK